MSLPLFSDANSAFLSSPDESTVGGAADGAGAGAGGGGGGGGGAIPGAGAGGGGGAALVEDNNVAASTPCE